MSPSNRSMILPITRHLGEVATARSPHRPAVSSLPAARRGRARGGAAHQAARARELPDRLRPRFDGAAPLRQPTKPHAWPVPAPVLLATIRTAALQAAD